MDNQRLFNIVKTSSEKLGVKTGDIKKRGEWNAEVKAFIDKVSITMLSLKDFGFKEKEVESFICGAESTMDIVLFFYLMKKTSKDSTDSEEFKKRVVSEWYSSKVFENLNDISDIVLDAFFEQKGGTCFTH